MKGCNRRLDPLLEYPAWLRRTAPTGISNDAMGSVPQHPFFLRVIYSLETYNRNWFLPYITVMYSTGPLFLSVIWKEYMNEEPLGLSRVRVLMQDAYNRYPWSFFTHHPGSSWHGKDARLIFWVSLHLFSPFVKQSAILTVVDGWALDATHSSRIFPCRSRGRLPMVDVPTAVTRRIEILSSIFFETLR